MRIEKKEKIQFPLNPMNIYDKQDICSYVSHDKVISFLEGGLIPEGFVVSETFAENHSEIYGNKEKIKTRNSFLVIINIPCPAQIFNIDGNRVWTKYIYYFKAFKDGFRYYNYLKNRPFIPTSTWDIIEAFSENTIEVVEVEKCR